MQIQIADERPPYVTFEMVAEEDRAATLEKGHFVTRDVPYAFVTPSGSKDRIPRKVHEWFAMLETQVAEGRFPQTWLTAFRASFEAWEKGQELPLEGTAIVNWPAISPAQVKHLLNLHIRTVEDLAAGNEELIGRLGMGGRSLVMKAQEWLAAAKGAGKTAAELEKLRVENEGLRAQIESLTEKVQLLAAEKSVKKL